MDDSVDGGGGNGNKQATGVSDMWKYGRLSFIFLPSAGGLKKKKPLASFLLGSHHL